MSLYEIRNVLLESLWLAIIMVVKHRSHRLPECYANAEILNFMAPSKLYINVATVQQTWSTKRKEDYLWHSYDGKDRKRPGGIRFINYPVYATKSTASSSRLSQPSAKACNLS